MQTFLPFRSFKDSAACLDNRRLNKQITEGYQILQCLLRIRYNTDIATGWRNHPAVKMWKGYERCLYEYIRHCWEEWEFRIVTKQRKGTNSHRGWKNVYFVLFPHIEKDSIIHPFWFDDDRVFVSHRSNLLRKDWNHYYPRFQLFHAEFIPSDNLEYFWPV